jgi:hypothetical protein
MNITFERGLINNIKNADDGRGYFSNVKIAVMYDTERHFCWGERVVGNEHVMPSCTAVINVAQLAGCYTRRQIADMIENVVAMKEVDAL